MMGPKTPLFGVKNAVLGVVRTVSESEGLLDTQEVAGSSPASPSFVTPSYVKTYDAIGHSFRLR